MYYAFGYVKGNVLKIHINGWKRRDKIVVHSGTREYIDNPGKRIGKKSQVTVYAANGKLKLTDINNEKSLKNMNKTGKMIVFDVDHGLSYNEVTFQVESEK